MTYERDLNRDVLLNTIRELQTLYPAGQFKLESQVWARDGHRRSPYRAVMLFGLSRREFEERLISLCHQVFILFPNLKSLLDTWQRNKPKISMAIRPYGFQNIRMDFIESAVQVMSENNNVVPSDKTLLMGIRQVAEKTVECVVGYGFGRPALPVDYAVCHVIEMVFRKGITAQHAPYVRDQLKRVVSNSSEWIDIHELFRLHAQAVCKRSQCHLCPVSECRSRPRQALYKRRPEPAREAASGILAIWEQWRQLLCE